jgi:hypothetical protein
MDEGNKGQKSQEQQVEQNKNTSLQDPGAQVADYGRSEQGLSNEKNGGQRQGNSSIPLDEEDTIGNP